MKEAFKSCRICPRNCLVDRLNGELGFCGVDAEMNIASICVHKGEEPAISGGLGICNVFFSGCNLHCIYCQNHEISRGFLPNGQSLAKSSAYTLSGALGAIESILRTGVKSVGFVSPSHLFPHIISIINGLRERGLNPITVYNTNSYDKVESIRQLEGMIDIFLPDFKYTEPGLAKEFSGAGDYPGVALAALKEMYRQKGSTLMTDDTGLAVNGMVIRHLVLPGHVEESKEALRLLADELSPGVHLSLMSQYYPTEEVCGHPMLNRQLHKWEYDSVVEEMDRLGFRHGWVQEMESSRTYRPDFSKEDPFGV